MFRFSPHINLQIIWPKYKQDGCVPADYILQTIINQCLIKLHTTVKDMLTDAICLSFHIRQYNMCSHYFKIVGLMKFRIVTKECNIGVEDNLARL